MSAYRSILNARHWYALAAATVTAVLVACGGGGGVDTGGTGGQMPLSFSSGSISGFGSVIVNGTRFDTTSSVVTDDDGQAHGADDLKLGMVVDVTAGPIASDASGNVSGAATAIQFHSEIKGPVQALDAAALTLTVLGQSVKVDANTVFAGITNGLAGLQVNDTVEVFAFFDAASGSYTATRIEKETGLGSYKLRGPIASLDSAAKTFMIGGAKIGYASAPSVPSLSNGLVVKVMLQTTQQAGVWVATQVSTAAPHVPDHAESEVEGFVTDFASAASFKVDGVTVDASGSSVRFPNGNVGQIANGVRLEVGGQYVNGVLVADKVEFNGSQGHGNGGHGDQEIELHGPVDSVSLASSTFVMRGITVHFDANTKFTGGTSASLAAGAKLQVKGNLISGSSDVLATEIQFNGH